MASELIVQTLKGPTSGANANKIIVPSGHELYAAGHVVQVVKSSIINTQYSTSSTTQTEINSGFRLTITPKSTDSVIIWMMSGHFNVTAATFGSFALYRSINGGLYSSLNVGTGNEAFRNRDTAVSIQQQNTVTWYDTPNTTSQVVYTPYWWRNSGGAFTLNDNGMGSFCIAIEVAG